MEIFMLLPIMMSVVLFTLNSINVLTLSMWQVLSPIIGLVVIVWILLAVSLVFALIKTIIDSILDRSDE